MILIASAAYVNSEFQIEFGRLPPAFLPVGNQRLFEHQVKMLLETFPKEQIYISLPSSYKVNQKDLNCLGRLGVKVVKIDEKLTLSSSISLVMQQLNFDGFGIRILHGDTLLTSIPNGFDLIAVANTDQDYLWEVENFNSTSELVWCGYFSFSDIALLQDCLSEPMIEFVEGIKKYSQKKSLKRVTVDSWSDFGHINTYFHSRTKITTERSFNSLTIREGCAFKTGKHESKINAEARWFKLIPVSLRIYCPQLIDFGVTQYGKPFYALEYLSIPPLNEVYVHGCNPVFYWEKIFTLCVEFLYACQLCAESPEIAEQIKLEPNHLVEKKTIARLEEFFTQNKRLSWGTNLSINGSSGFTVRNIVDDCLHLAKKIPSIPGVLHGDFCLSNILFDSRSDRIKVIDPRGLDGLGNTTLFGDLSYDVAKLSHSLVGLYDHIMAGAYKLDVNYGDESFHADLEIFLDERTVEIQKLFLRKSFSKINSFLDVMPLTILLFLSMLPLHVDNKNRQLALFANALRLYVFFLGGKKESQ